MSVYEELCFVCPSSFQEGYFDATKTGKIDKNFYFAILIIFLQ